jgi:hypothetical protein
MNHRMPGSRFDMNSRQGLINSDMLNRCSGSKSNTRIVRSTTMQERGLTLFKRLLTHSSQRPHGAKVSSSQKDIPQILSSSSKAYDDKLRRDNQEEALKRKLRARFYTFLSPAYTWSWYPIWLVNRPLRLLPSPLLPSPLLLASRLLPSRLLPGRRS